MSDKQSEGHYDHFLDARGLNCPLPVLKAKLQLNRMQDGEVLCVEATDPHATIDFKAYCARSGHELLHIITSDEVITLYLEKMTKKD